MRRSAVLMLVFAVVLGLASVFLARSWLLRLAQVLRRHAGKVCVCELTPLFDVSQPTVSHHLKVLREAGLDTIPGGGGEILVDRVRRAARAAGARDFLAVTRTKRMILRILIGVVLGGGLGFASITAK